MHKKPDNSLEPFKTFGSPIFSLLFLNFRSSQRNHDPIARGKEADKKILKIETHNGGPVTKAPRQTGNPSLVPGLLTDQRQVQHRDRGHINVFIPEGQLSMDEAIVQGMILINSDFEKGINVRLSPSPLIGFGCDLVVYWAGRLGLGVSQLCINFVFIQTYSLISSRIGKAYGLSGDDKNDHIAVRLLTINSPQWSGRRILCPQTCISSFIKDR